MFFNLSLVANDCFQDCDLDNNSSYEEKGPHYQMNTSKNVILHPLQKCEQYVYQPNEQSRFQTRRGRTIAEYLR